MTDKARLLNHLEVFADTVCTPSERQEMDDDQALIDGALRAQIQRDDPARQVDVVPERSHNERQIGPFCHQCGTDTKGKAVSYVPAPKQGGPFYYCAACRPPVTFVRDLQTLELGDDDPTQ